MNKHWTLLSAAGLSLGLLFTGPLLAADPTLDEVIAGYIETSGGKDAMDAIKTAKAEGTMIFPGGLEAPFTIEFQPPERRMRLDFEFQGMTAVNAYDGETGWAIQPFLGKTTAEPMAEDQLKQAQDQADFFGPLIDYADKGHSPELIGITDVEGTEAYHIKLTKANGDVENWYLDTEYNLPFRVEAKADIQGQQVETNTIYGDYKEVGEMVFAHAITVDFGAAGSQTIVVNDMELNVDIDNDRFTMPVAETATSE